jgi:hypothetical protein
VTQQETLNLLSRCFSVDELEHLSNNSTFRALMERTTNVDDFEQLAMLGHRILECQEPGTEYLNRTT